MKLIDQYVYAVTKQLPVDLREDIGKELRINIEDMLPEEATEGEVSEVLEKLGNPRKLADEYNPRKRYLIGPAVYDLYIYVLKLVIGICTAVFAGITILGWFADIIQVDLSIYNFVDLTLELFLSIGNGVIQGAIWVTLVFVIYERINEKEGSSKASDLWSVDNLPELPTYSRKISRGETIFTMIAIIFGTALLRFQPQLIAIYLRDDNGIINRIPLFNIERLEKYMVFILLFAIYQLGMCIWKFVVGHFNIPMLIGDVISNALQSILTILILRDKAIINSEFIKKLYEILDISDKSFKGWDMGMKVFILIVILICIWDSVWSFIKYRKAIKNFA